MSTADKTTKARGMKRSVRWLAWGMFGLTLACLMVGGVFSFINGPVPSPDNSASPIFNAVVLTLLAFAIMGALIISRHPANAIGWIFSVTAVVASLGGAADGYAQRALLVAPGSLPGGLALASFARLTEGPLFFSVVIFILFLFPNGRPLSRRWRWIVWLAIAVTVGETFFEAFTPGPLTNTQYQNYSNPFGIPALSAFGSQLDGLLFFAQLAVLVLSVVSLVLRYRRSVGEEREQLKWLASAGAFIALAFLSGPVIWFTPALSGTPLWPILFVVGVTLIPLSIGIAILKYRLYEIDIIINRTLVYVPLTAILAGIFASSITLSQKLFIALTGQSSDAATVLTTLIVVAAFDPLKTGLQHLVDRRFKEPQDPAKGLKTIRQQAQALLQVIDADTSTQRLLEAAVRAFGAKGGAVYLERDGQLKVAHTLGEWSDDPQLSMPLESNGRQLGLLALGARHSGLEYTAQDRETLRQTVEPVAQAISLAGHGNGAKG